MSDVVITMRPVTVAREDAAAALGVGITTFSERIQPDLQVIRIGAKVLIPVAELERWAQEQAAPTLADSRRRA